MSKKTPKKSAAESAPNEDQAHDEAATSVVDDDELPEGAAETSEMSELEHQIAALNTKLVEQGADLDAARAESNERGAQIFSLQEAAARAEAERAGELASMAETYAAEITSIKEAAAADQAKHADEITDVRAQGEAALALARTESEAALAAQAAEHANACGALNERFEAAMVAFDVMSRDCGIADAKAKELEGQLTQAQVKIATFAGLAENGRLYKVSFLDRKLVPVYVVATNPAHALEVAERCGHAKDDIRSAAHFGDRVAL